MQFYITHSLIYICKNMENTFQTEEEQPIDTEDLSLVAVPKLQSADSQVQLISKERFGRKPTITYRPELDGLRCLAILPVICFHFQILQDFTSGGFGGVDVFFVISGFLINSIIFSELLKDKFSLLVFYERRVRRLFSAFFSVLVIVAISGSILYFEKDHYEQLIREEIAALGNFANVLFYIKRDEMGDGYFDDNTKYWPFLHFWSLAVQEQFYILMPLSLMLLRKCTKKSSFMKYMLFYMILTIALSLSLSVQITQSNQMFAFYLLPCRAWELCLGGLIAILLHEKSIQKVRNTLGQALSEKKTTFLLQTISWFGLLMILFSYAFFNKKDDHFPGYKALLPCFGTALFIASNFIRYKQKNSSLPLKTSDLQANQSQEILPKRKVLSTARLLSWPPIILIGEISYSAYLWHWPIWVFSNYFMAQKGLTLVSKIFCIALTLLIAYFSTKEVENPIRDKRKVSTSMLWKGFGIIWIGFMSLLFYILTVQIREQKTEVIKEIELEDVRNITVIFNESVPQSYLLYPKYDDEGYLLQNPFRSLNAQEMSLQKMGRPSYANKSLRYPYQNVTKGPLIDLKPILINYSEEDRKKNKRVCIAALGSSHTEQHFETLQQLAFKYNVSVCLMASSGTDLSFFTTNIQEWDEFRMEQLKALKPKLIFAQNKWQTAAQTEFQELYQKSLDPLLQLSTPPEYIDIFGDIPSTNIIHSNTENLRPVLDRRYAEEGDSLDFLETVQVEELEKQIEIQNKINNFIKENYNGTGIEFYPHLHQFMQDRETGYVQVVGSEADGKLLYYNRNHLSPRGSQRYKNYIQDKVFLKARGLCR